jgi:hypothetical protein
MFLDMNRARSNIIDNIIRLTYFMRGSISYREMLLLSFYERERVAEFIHERLENESKKMNPVY